MKRLCLIPAIIGAVGSYAFFFGFFRDKGVDLSPFISALFVNGAAGGFSADSIISCFVFWALIFQQHKRANGPKPILWIALNVFIELLCALPAYFYAREKA